MDTVLKEIDGVKFHIVQFPGRKVIRLEKRTIELILPILGKIAPGGDKEEDSDKNKKKGFLDLDISGAVLAFQDTLSSLSDQEFEDYIFSMIDYTKAELKIGNSVTMVELRDKEKFDMVFCGISTLTIYKLLFEIMKVNRFAFFELVGGMGIDLMSFFNVLKKKKTELSQESEKLEN